MAFLAPIAAIASTVLSAVGMVASAQAQSNAANYNAQVQQINAQVSSEQGAAQAAQKARESRQRQAAGQAAVMQGGFELAGSPLDVLDQAQAQGNLTYLTSVYDGQVKATGYQNNATLYRSQADSAPTAGFIGAGGKLLGGLSDVYRLSNGGSYSPQMSV